MQKADTVFSIFIRIEEADENGMNDCITCGQNFHWRQLTCGHFFKRDNQGTRYHEVNCGPQCMNCQRIAEESGKDVRHENYIINKYGQDALDEIDFLHNQEVKMMKHEFREIESIYKKRVKEIAKKKGLIVNI